MQNPSHDKKPSDKKPIEAAKKGAPSAIHSGQKPVMKNAENKPKGK